MLAAAPSALADGSLQLSVSPDPVRNLPVHFSMSGTTGSNVVQGYPGNYSLLALARPASLGPCAAEEFQDPGSQTPKGDFLGAPSPTNLSPNSPFYYSWTDHVDYTAPVGSYLFCAWMQDNQAYPQTVGTAQLAFSLRAPHFTLAVTTPARAMVGRRGVFGVRGQAEAPGWVDAELLPPYVVACNNSGASCHKQYIQKCTARPFQDPAANPGSTGYYALFSRRVSAARTFTFTRKLLALQPGAWRLCAWLQDGGDGSSSNGGEGPIALAQSRTFNVRRK
jgi:hypothetical protein